MASIEQIRQKLQQVNDPLMNQDVVSQNMVKSIDIKGDAVHVQIELAIPNYPYEQELKSRIEKGLSDVPGVSKIEIGLTARVARPAATKEPVKGVKNIIAVYACKGGVGKSTVSTNLAVALQKQGHRVGLLDADIHGPNIPLMMGIQDNPKGAPNNKLLPLEAHGVQLMSIGFLTNANLPSIWRGPMIHGAIQQLLRDTLWDNLDYLIVDMPPGTGDAQLTLAQSAPLSGVVFVTTPQTVSLVDGVKGIGMFKKLGVPVLGLVENMSGFTCPHCDKDTFIFSKGGGEKESRKQNIPFLGSIPIDPTIVQGGDAGKPIVVSNPKALAAQKLSHVAIQLNELISRGEFSQKMS